jgi:hypothetical protein
VERDADRLERFVRRCSAERLRSIGSFEAELAGSPSGREVFMPAACDVGVQPDGDLSYASELASGVGDLLELVERLDVERADPGPDGRTDLVLALADAREDDFLRGNARP